MFIGCLKSNYQIYNQMLTRGEETNKRPTYIELKNAINFKDKERTISKLGGSIYSSIEALKKIRNQILAESNISNLSILMDQYQKENKQFNNLQNSLAQVDENTQMVEKIKSLSKEFIQSNNPQELENKLNYMMKERQSNYNIQERISKQEHMNQNLDQLLMANKDEIRNKNLKEEQQKIKQIARLVEQVKTIAVDTSRMIMAQGLNLNIAAKNMDDVTKLLKDGKDNLVEANQYQRNSNKRLFCCCIVVIAIVTIVLMIMYSSK